MLYQLFHLIDDNHPGTASLLNIVESDISRLVTGQSAEIYGTFTSLLGMASNALYLVTFGDRPINLQVPDGIRVERSVMLTPTRRPTDHSPRTRDGLYVFRWFRVGREDIDEIVRLSAEAWTSFEADFEAEIQGLFVADTDAPEQMLLLTWYSDLSAWEKSRNPSPEARENFLARHRLTRNALPIATRLHTGSASGLVSHS